MKNYAEAAKRFAFFRDTPQYLQLPGLSDGALLRLGHAYAALNQWEQARQAHELLLSQLAGSKWTQEAHYGVGWAREQQGQYDQAVAAYTKAATIHDLCLVEKARMAALARPARAFLATVASESVQRPSPDLRVVIVKALDDLGERRVIQEVVEDLRAAGTNLWVGVPEPPSDR